MKATSGKKGHGILDCVSQTSSEQHLYKALHVYNFSDYFPCLKSTLMIMVQKALFLSSLYDEHTDARAVYAFAIRSRCDSELGLNVRLMTPHSKLFPSF